MAAISMLQAQRPIQLDPRLLCPNRATALTRSHLSTTFPTVSSITRSLGISWTRPPLSRQLSKARSCPSSTVLEHTSSGSRTASSLVSLVRLHVSDSSNVHQPDAHLLMHSLERTSHAGNPSIRKCNHGRQYRSFQDLGVLAQDPHIRNSALYRCGSASWSTQHDPHLTERCARRLRKDHCSSRRPKDQFYW